MCETGLSPDIPVLSILEAWRVIERFVVYGVRGGGEMGRRHIIQINKKKTPKYNTFFSEVNKL